MKTITLKIPDEMDKELRRRAAEQNLCLSEAMRRALARELESEKDFASLAAPYKGMFQGPADLSMREGYAGSHPR